MLVPMGVSNDLVEAGVKALMSEVNEFIKSNSNGRPWKMVMASGTGATAYFAARFACEELQIVAVPCVGKSEYLEKLLLDLTIKFGSIDSKSLHVISTAAVPNRAFAQVTRVHWDLWKTITSCTNIDFDLLYAPRVFEILRSICPKREDGDRESLKSLFSGYNIIYYHCGGMEGNPSQIQRYKSRYPGIE